MALTLHLNYAQTAEGIPLLVMFTRVVVIFYFIYLRKHCKNNSLKQI